MTSCLERKWQDGPANKMRRNSQFGRGTLPEAWQEAVSDGMRVETKVRSLTFVQKNGENNTYNLKNLAIFLKGRK